MKSELKCDENFQCFEKFYDVVADYVLYKEIIPVDCEEFEQQGDMEEIITKMMHDPKVKLCPFLVYVAKELKQYGL